MEGKVVADVRKYLSDNEFEKAEQLCIQAIKSQAGKKDPKSADMFLLLAEVISGESQQPDISAVERNNRILKAAALCNYVLNLCKLDPSLTGTSGISATEKEAVLMINSLQELMFSSIGIDVSKGRDTFDKAKEYHAHLEEIRTTLREDLESLPIASHDNLDEEFKHYRKIQDLYKRVGEKMKKLFSNMLDDCSLLLGRPPCHFAAIALGSLARMEATPYSDLEWALLIERKDERCKVYFRNLTQLMHLMVINFGETILPSMDIRCLRSWFYDSVTPRGLAFDGALPQACKTPLGKREDDGSVVYELIGTPEEISKFQGLNWMVADEQLAGVLRTVIVINEGEEAETLVQLYKQLVNMKLDRLVTLKGEGETEGKKLREATAHSDLSRDVCVFNPRLSQENQAGKFFDVKKEIYRLMDRFVASLALYFNADCQSAWECLEWLRGQGILGEKGMRNLFVAVSIGAEMRARAYTEEGRQYDYLDCWAFIDACQKGLATAVCMLGVSSVETLFRYYFTVLPFLTYIQSLCSLGIAGINFNQIGNREFFSDSATYRASVNMRFRQYSKAKIQLQKQLMAYPEDGESASHLGNVLKCFQKFPEAISLHRKALHVFLCSNGDQYLVNGKKLRSVDEITCWRDFVQPLMPLSMCRTHRLRVDLYNLGLCYGNLDQVDNAIDCLRCSIELSRHRIELLQEGYMTTLELQDLALSLNVLGQLYRKCKNGEDLDCLQESLSLYATSRSLYTISGEATAKSNLGVSHHWRGEFHEAQVVLRDAIDQYSYAYGESNGNGVAHAHCALGVVYLCLQRYHEAVKILTRCMKLVAKPFQYGSPISMQSDVEPYLKIALFGAGILQGSDDVLTRFVADAVEACRVKEIITEVVLFLADFCIRSQKPLLALSLLENTLSTLRGVHGETPHYNYASCLGFLGRLCCSLGKNEMAEQHLLGALRNHREYFKVHGRSGRNTDAERNEEFGLLSSLAYVYKVQKSYVQALKYYHECLAIQCTMLHEVDGESVVVMLFDLGTTYCLIGKFSQGILFLEKALDGFRAILEEEQGLVQIVDCCRFLETITEALCTALTESNQSEKIPNVTARSSRLKDALKISGNGEKLHSHPNLVSLLNV